MPWRIRRSLWSRHWNREGGPGWPPPSPAIPAAGSGWTAAARRTEAPLELTIDAHDVVRVEVHDQAPMVALGLEEHPGGTAARLHRPQPTASIGGAPCRRGERDQVLWAELRSGDDGG
jgi:hypothetical protein